MKPSALAPCVLLAASLGVGQVALAQPAPARSVSLLPPGGVLVTAASSADSEVGLAAGAGGVAVTWREITPGNDPHDLRDEGHGRAFAAGTLSALGAAVFVSYHDYFSTDGSAPVALSNGGLYGAHCAGMVSSGQMECGFETLAGPALTDRWSFRGPEPTAVGSFAATGSGTSALMLSASFAEVFYFASANRNRRELIADVGLAAAGRQEENPPLIDALAVAPCDAGRAVAVWRSGVLDGGAQAIHGRELGTDGRPRGRAVSLSVRGEAVGAPSVAWVAGGADVVFSHRQNARDPEHLAFVRWVPGRPLVRVETATSAAAPLSPRIVPQPGAPTCAIVSWIERGATAGLYAGRLCDDATRVTDVGRVTAPGVAINATALATDGHHVFVAWREARARARNELRLGRLAWPAP